MTKYLIREEDKEVFKVLNEGLNMYVAENKDGRVGTIVKADSRFRLVESIEPQLTIRETLKLKFALQLDKQCDKGEETYGHTLDDASDKDFDWRDMLIEELIDGLQYQEKEIKRLKEQLQFLRR